MLRLRFADPGDSVRPLQPQDRSGVHVWRTEDGQIIAYGFSADGFWWMDWPRMATYRFAARDPFVTAFPDPSARRDTVCDVYRRSVLPMALQAIGFEALHASAIVTTRGIVAFAGRSKAGKSTVAFGLSRRGYRQWSDDSVVFRTSTRGIEAVALPFKVRLRPHSPALIAAEPNPSNPSNPSNLSNLSNLLNPRTSVAALCLVAQVDADRAGEALAIRRLTPAEAFPSVLTHAHVFDPSDIDRRRRMMEAYLELVASVPVYEIRFKAAPENFSDLLDAVSDICDSGTTRSFTDLDRRGAEGDVPVAVRSPIEVAG